MLEQTEVVTCKCNAPDKKYLDQRYDDLWVCDRCHHFGGSDTWESKTNIIRPTNITTRSEEVTMTNCSHNDMQHLEDKIDDFRNAVHDKVLGYGAITKGVFIGLAVALGILFFLRSLGIYTLNPIVPQQQQTAPTQGGTTPAPFDLTEPDIVIPIPEEEGPPIPLVPLE